MMSLSPITRTEHTADQTHNNEAKLGFSPFYVLSLEFTTHRNYNYYCTFSTLNVYTHLSLSIPLSLCVARPAAALTRKKAISQAAWGKQSWQTHA